MAFICFNLSSNPTKPLVLGSIPVAFNPFWYRLILFTSPFLAQVSQGKDNYKKNIKFRLTLGIAETYKQ